MPSPKHFSIFTLFLLGVLFAGGNLWFTAARSLIPLNLRGMVTHKERLIEKTSGVDDVCIVTIDSDQHLQVDGDVFAALAEGQSVRKAAWSRSLEIDGRAFMLSWSRDFRGMAWAMPVTVAIFAMLGIKVVVRARQIADEQSPGLQPAAGLATNGEPSPPAQ